MTDFQKAFDAGFDAIKGYVDRSFATVYKRLKALEEAQEDAMTKRVAELEAQVKGLSIAKPRVRVPAGSDK